MASRPTSNGLATEEFASQPPSIRPNGFVGFVMPFVASWFLFFSCV
jgi:hypothetical protein